MAFKGSVSDDIALSTFINMQKINTRWLFYLYSFLKHWFINLEMLVVLLISV